MTTESDPEIWRAKAADASALLLAQAGPEPDAADMTPEQQSEAWQALYDRRMALVQQATELASLRRQHTELGHYAALMDREVDWLRQRGQPSEVR